MPSKTRFKPQEVVEFLNISNYSNYNDNENFLKNNHFDLLNAFDNFIADVMVRKLRCLVLCNP